MECANSDTFIFWYVFMINILSTCVFEQIIGKIQIESGEMKNQKLLKTSVN